MRLTINCILFMTLHILHQVWLLHRENGTRKCIVTTSEADSNWLRAVEPAESAADANCLAVSVKNELYLVTSADVGGGAPLSYFAKEDPTTEFWTSWTQAWANQRNCSRCSVHGQFETVADYRVHISLWHDMSFQGNPQNRSAIPKKNYIFSLVFGLINYLSFGLIIK